jgi:septal ring factor EnvC (AmiA/AmiB activator)
MHRLVALTAVVAVLVGALAGYLWWGLPTSRLGSELREARSSAERLGQQLADMRAQREQLEAQLKAEKARRETLETDLKREKEVSARLHRLVSEGKK